MSNPPPRPSARAWQYQRRETCWWTACREPATEDQDSRWRGRYCETHVDALRADAEREAGQ